MATQAVATQDNKALTKASVGRDLKQWLGSEAFKQAVAVSLPKHLTPDRFIRTGLTAMLKTPKLAECTQESVFECMLTLSQLGLEPDGRRAHLIPFKKNIKTEKGWVSEMRCQLIIDYKGIVELVMNSGLVCNIYADVVCENDEFEYDMGEVIKHKIDFRTDRGRPYAVYCRVKFKDGSVQAEAMSIFEVEKVRARSKAATDGPWVTDFNEMAKKTVFKRLSKWCVWSADPKKRELVDKDDDQFGPETRKPRAEGTIDISQLTASMDPNRGHDATAAIEEAAFEEVEPESANETTSRAAAGPVPDLEENEPPTDLPHYDAWPEDPQGRWFWVGQGVFEYSEETGNYKKHSLREYIAPKAETTTARPISFKRGNK